MANLFRAGKPLQFCRDYLLLCGAGDTKGGDGAEAPPPYSLVLEWLCPLVMPPTTRGLHNPVDQIELRIGDRNIVNDQLQQFTHGVYVVTPDSKALRETTLYLLGRQIMKIGHISP